jgi:hypothetical protein
VEHLNVEKKDELLKWLRSGWQKEEIKEQRFLDRLNWVESLIPNKEIIVWENYCSEDDDIEDWEKFAPTLYPSYYKLLDKFWIISEAGVAVGEVEVCETDTLLIIRDCDCYGIEMIWKINK